MDSAFAGSPFAPEQQFSTRQLSINPIRRSDELFELNFTAVPGATFTTLAAANFALGPTNWVVLGTVMEISPGQYRFVDRDTTNNASRFYQVRSP